MMHALVIRVSIVEQKGVDPAGLWSPRVAAVGVVRTATEPLVRTLAVLLAGRYHQGDTQGPECGVRELRRKARQAFSGCRARWRRGRAAC